MDREDWRALTVVLGLLSTMLIYVTAASSSENAELRDKVKEQSAIIKALKERAVPVTITVHVQKSSDVAPTIRGLLPALKDAETLK